MILGGAQTETVFLPFEFACFGFATHFLGSDRATADLSAADGFFLLLYDFIAIDCINNHQFAKRLRMKEIEKEIPCEYYSREEELRVGVVRETETRAVQSCPWVNRVFFGSRARTMGVRFSRARFLMVLAGGIYLVYLVVYSLAAK